ncbi:21941_t:CDS:2 [Gigaspora margarita]|uniref:21941_t:CDS:1 n=1 Tax=Gigaspora margarita TaxID=4874 RepID=A0ABM8W3M2_GIGMA|nr:21941_t:CDS:2 [Gigaspora margarita]
MKGNLVEIVQASFMLWFANNCNTSIDQDKDIIIACKRFHISGFTLLLVKLASQLEEFVNQYLSYIRLSRKRFVRFELVINNSFSTESMR